MGELTSREKTIILIVIYSVVIGLLSLQRLFMQNHLSAVIVFIALIIPLVFGSALCKMRGGASLGFFTALAGFPLLWEDGLLVPVGFMIASLLLGISIGWLNQRRARRQEEWQRTKNVKELSNEDIFENSINMIHFVDKNGNILRRNEQSHALLGYAKSRRLSMAEYVHPDDIENVKSALIRVFERGMVENVKARFISVKKVVIPVEIAATRAKGHMSAIMEIVDRREMEELERQLAETEARYRYLIEDGIDTLNSAIIIIDKKREVVWANETIETFFGVDRERLIGIDAMVAFNRYVGVLEEIDDFRRIVADAVTNNKRIDSHICRVRCDSGCKKRIFEYRSIPIETDKYQGGRIDYYIDITEIKRLEEGLREKTERLERSNETLEEFSHVVSHDLKEPLRTLSVYCSYLLEDYKEKLDGEGREYLTIIMNCSDRMRKLVDNLRSLSSIRLDAASFVPVNVGDVLKEAKEDLEVLLRDRRVNLQIANHFPQVMGNKTRITELFHNLISNAVKFNDKALPVIRVGWKDTGNGHYTFFVQDNGIGIEARYQEKIFGMFEQLNPKEFEGTGAGLAISKRIVTEHKGEIWVKSEVGKGTTFYFSIPKVAAKNKVVTNAK
ncbi:PAS domain S-box protein [Candidatus Acetothermia bacterium]|jgi:PAS domain S-box-containing protein|nr:PAS domain S-box protein [Candidatus Acetothermia bacterium]MCI2427494.1 PAS domain S-box protein [Candidatus Acetothermia bacterium]MCI2427996.1 PAS domain S-box protein [Candidatus Acetothermia bacterium]